jgi:hypothetical protein
MHERCLAASNEEKKRKERKDHQKLHAGSPPARLSAKLLL